MTYALPCGSFTCPLYHMSNLLHISLASVHLSSSQSSPSHGSPTYSLLLSYWPFSSLLNQSQWYIFTQCKELFCNNHGKSVLKMWKIPHATQKYTFWDAIIWAVCGPLLAFPKFLVLLFHSFRNIGFPTHSLKLEMDCVCIVLRRRWKENT